MRKVILAATALLLLGGCSNKKNNGLLITVDSHYNMKNTIEHFSKAMAKKGYKVTNILYYTPIAKSQNIYLHPTKSITLDKPKVYSAILTCNQSMATELPIRVAVYSKLGGKVQLSYTQPEYWSLKHNIKDKNCLAIVRKIARDFDEAMDSIEK